jgi:hypothetical protein
VSAADEQKQFLKNEEKLWDLAAITIASSLVNHYGDYDLIAVKAYTLAEHLMAERRRRLAEPVKAPPEKI